MGQRKEGRTRSKLQILLRGLKIPWWARVSTMQVSSKSWHYNSSPSKNIWNGTWALAEWVQQVRSWQLYSVVNVSALTHWVNWWDFWLGKASSTDQLPPYASTSHKDKHDVSWRIQGKSIQHDISCMPRKDTQTEKHKIELLVVSAIPRNLLRRKKYNQ
jgi:hypothetical protein